MLNIDPIYKLIKMNKYIMDQLSQIESYCFSITENSVYICKNMYISFLKENI